MFRLAVHRPPTLLKKRLWHRCFPVNFVKFLRTLLTEHLRWLLLYWYILWTLSNLILFLNFFFFNIGKHTHYKIDYCFKLFTLTAWYFLSKIVLTKICFHDITLFTSLVFFFPSLRQRFIQQMWVTRLHDSLANDFFQSPFEANEMFCLLNKFVLITNHKQLLKCF